MVGKDYLPLQCLIHKPIKHGIDMPESLRFNYNLCNWRLYEAPVQK